MALMRYEPFNLLNQLQREMNRLLDTGRLGDEESGNILADWAPAVDIKEEPNQFIITPICRVSSKDIEITLENGVPDPERPAERREERKKPNSIAGLSEVRGTFLRRFSLPDVADADKVSAKCKDGVLEVIVLKREAAQPRRIAIES